MGNRTTLNRALSKLGICSRVDAVKLISEGQVLVNNNIVTKTLTWVDIGNDKITILKQKTNQKQNIYLAMNKPKGYITTKSDERGRKTVYNLISKEYTKWLFPAGRLDKDSQGLLLFTNDGLWQDRILSPQSHLKKTYLVWTKKPLTQKDITTLEQGINLDNCALQPCTITSESDHYKIIISEGKNRQIRKMISHVGTTVTKLERIQIDHLSLEKLNLKSGEVKQINPKDIFD